MPLRRILAARLGLRHIEGLRTLAAPLLAGLAVVLLLLLFALLASDTLIHYRVRIGRRAMA